MSVVEQMAVDAADNGLEPNQPASKTSFDRTTNRQARQTFIAENVESGRQLKSYSAAKNFSIDVLRQQLNEDKEGVRRALHRAAQNGVDVGDIDVDAAIQYSSRNFAQLLQTNDVNAFKGLTVGRTKAAYRAPLQSLSIETQNVIRLSVSVFNCSHCLK